MSRFESVQPGAPIEVFALTQAFTSDPDPRKVNLGVGGEL
jgi:aspartate/tyrosine/aromatic aminotransferase